MLPYFHAWVRPPRPLWPLYALLTLLMLLHVSLATWAFHPVPKPPHAPWQPVYCISEEFGGQAFLPCAWTDTRGEL